MNLLKENKDKLEKLEDYMKAVTVDNAIRKKAEYEEEKHIRAERKKAPYRKTEIKETPEDRIYINYLHQFISRKDLTSKIMEKEQEFGEDYRDKIFINY